MNLDHLKPMAVILARGGRDRRLLFGVTEGGVGRLGAATGRVRIWTSRRAGSELVSSGLDEANAHAARLAADPTVTLACEVWDVTDPNCPIVINWDDWVRDNRPTAVLEAPPWGKETARYKACNAEYEHAGRPARWKLWPEPKAPEQPALLYTRVDTRELETAPDPDAPRVVISFGPPPPNPLPAVLCGPLPVEPATRAIVGKRRFVVDSAGVLVDSAGVLLEGPDSGTPPTAAFNPAPANADPSSDTVATAPAEVIHVGLPQGTRVRVTAAHRPPPPHDTGVIWQHRPEHGGYLVQHDSSPWGDGLHAGHHLFGWAYNEIEVIPQDAPGAAVQENPYVKHRREEQALMLLMGVNIDSPDFKLQCAAKNGADFLRGWRSGHDSRRYIAALTKAGEAAMQAAGKLYDDGPTFWFLANAEQHTQEQSAGDIPDVTHPTGVVFAGVKKDARWFEQLAFVALHAEAGVNNDHSDETLRFRSWLGCQKIDRSQYHGQWVFNLVRSWRLSRAAYSGWNP